MQPQRKFPVSLFKIQYLWLVISRAALTILLDDTTMEITNFRDFIF